MRFNLIKTIKYLNESRNIYDKIKTARIQNMKFHRWYIFSHYITY